MGELAPIPPSPALTLPESHHAFSPLGLYPRHSLHLQCPLSSKASGELLLILQYPTQASAPLRNLSLQFKIMWSSECCMSTPSVASTASGRNPLNRAGGSCRVHDWVHGATDNSWHEGALPTCSTERGKTEAPTLGTSEGKAGTGSGPSPSGSSTVRAGTPFVCFMLKHGPQQVLSELGAGAVRGTRDRALPSGPLSAGGGGTGQRTDRRDVCPHRWSDTRKDFGVV